MTHVAIHHLTKRFPGSPQAALDGASLDVPSGLILTLVGPSGCGKSTLLRVVAGLTDADSGDVLFDGRSLAGVPPERRGAVMMVQDHLLFPHLTVAENVGFGLRMRGLAADAIRRRVGAMLDLVRLTGLEDRRPESLSGGQAQRVALARALVVEPKVLLLDEPLSSLDPGLRGEMRALVRSVQAETRITTLFVTHDREEALALGDRLALIDAGRILQAGQPEDLFERPRSRAAAAFFGAANVIDGMVAAGIFSSPAGEWPLAGATRDGPATAAVRPEALRLGPPGPAPARITAFDYRGTHTLATVAAGGMSLTVSLDPVEARTFAIDDPVGLMAAPSRIWILPEEAAQVRDSS